MSRDGLEASCDILHQLVEEIEARGPELDAVETTGASFTASAKVRPAEWGFDSTTETSHNYHNQIRWSSDSVFLHITQVENCLWKVAFERLCLSWFNLVRMVAWLCLI